MYSATSDHQARRDRRRYKRAHVLFSASLITGDQEVGAVLYDLSANGTRVELARPLGQHSALTLRIGRAMDFHVEPIWANDRAVGLRFRDAPDWISSVFSGVLPGDCLAVA